MQQKKKDHGNNDDNGSKPIFIPAGIINRFRIGTTCEREKHIAQDESSKHDRPYFFNAVPVVHGKIIKD